MRDLDLCRGLLSLNLTPLLMGLICTSGIEASLTCSGSRPGVGRLNLAIVLSNKGGPTTLISLSVDFRTSGALSNPISVDLEGLSVDARIGTDVAIWGRSCCA